MADEADVTERARAVLAGTTDGPWVAITFGDDEPQAEESSVVSEGERTASGYGFDVAVDLRAGDAEFIAAARSLVPELVAEVEQLRRRLAELTPEYARRWPDGHGTHYPSREQAILSGSTIEDAPIESRWCTEWEPS